MRDAQERLMNPSKFHGRDEKLSKDEFDYVLGNSVNALRYTMAALLPMQEDVNIYHLWDAIEPHILELSRIESVYSNYGWDLKEKGVDNEQK